MLEVFLDALIDSLKVFSKKELQKRLTIKVN